MTHATKGVLAMLGACLTWGFAPFYYSYLTHLGAEEVLAHRTLWSVVTFVIVIAITRRFAATRRTIRHPRTMALIFLAGIMIAINWYVFIYSVGAGRVTESSLGYYIMPLVMVLLGWVVFGEALSRLQWCAVALALIAVLLLTFGLGKAPVLALIIAVTFGIYGMLKRMIQVDSIVSVTLEVVLLLPIALGYLIWLGHMPDTTSLILLIFSGVITAGPLMLMTYATQNVTMATVGLIQYLNPMLQFFSAIVILGEIITGWHVLAIGLIWVALALYSLAAFRAERKNRSTPAIVSST